MPQVEVVTEAVQQIGFLERLITAAVVIGWYLVVRWCLAKIFEDDRENSVWYQSFNFWMPTLIAIPVSFLLAGGLYLTASAVYWVFTGTKPN